MLANAFASGEGTSFSSRRMASRPYRASRRGAARRGAAVSASRVHACVIDRRVLLRRAACAVTCSVTGREINTMS